MDTAEPEEHAARLWETVTETVQSAVPDAVDGVRFEKSALVSEPVTLHVIVDPSDTVSVNVELSELEPANEKLSLTEL